MHGGADEHTPSALSLIPIAVAAAAVLVLALVISGSRSGTIVVQRVVEPISRRNGPQTRISFLMVTETSASGTVTRFASETSYGHLLAQSSVIAGNTLERYIPTDDTVYVMTDAAYEAAFRAYVRRHFPHVHARLAPPQSFAGSWLEPGPESFFKVQLQRGNYQLAGQKRIDGRRVVELVPSPGRGSIAFALHSAAEMTLIPAYVSPHSYDPIEEKSNGTVRYRWTEYRVLPATAANQRLLSLTAEHPHARISDSAIAYWGHSFRKASPIR